MRMTIKMHYYFVALLIFLIIGCSNLRKRPALAPDAYLKWYGSTENKWYSQDTVNNLVFKVKVYPKEVNIALCALNRCEPKETLLASLKQKEEINSFLLDIKGIKSGREDLFSHSAQMSSTDKILYLSNEIKKDLFAFSSDNDTLFCNSVIYEPSIPGNIKLLIDFHNPDHQSITRILFNDRLLSMVPVEFLLLPSDHSNFPTLNLKNYE